LSNEPALAQVLPPPPVAAPKPLFARRSVGTATPRASETLFGDEPTSASSLPESTETLEEIWRDIGDCTRCALFSGRTQVVNTHGNHKARLMFVGEAPGADEDPQGKPF